MNHHRTAPGLSVAPPSPQSRPIGVLEELDRDRSEVGPDTLGAGGGGTRRHGLLGEARQVGGRGEDEVACELEALVLQLQSLGRGGGASVCPRRCKHTSCSSWDSVRRRPIL